MQTNKQGFVLFESHEGNIFEKYAADSSEKKKYFRFQAKGWEKRSLNYRNYMKENKKDSV